MFYTVNERLGDKYSRQAQRIKLQICFIVLTRNKYFSTPSQAASPRLTITCGIEHTFVNRAHLIKQNYSQYVVNCKSIVSIKKMYT